jgi:hypothetical protein
MAKATLLGPETHQHWTERVPREAAQGLRLCHPGVEVTFDQRTGAVAEALLEASLDAELLVLGSRALRGLSGVLVGSAGRSVVARAEDVPAASEPLAAGAASRDAIPQGVLFDWLNEGSGGLFCSAGRTPPGSHPEPGGATHGCIRAVGCGVGDSSGRSRRTRSVSGRVPGCRPDGGCGCSHADLRALSDLGPCVERGGSMPLLKIAQGCTRSMGSAVLGCRFTCPSAWGRSPDGGWAHSVPVTDLCFKC